VAAAGNFDTSTLVMSHLFTFSWAMSGKVESASKQAKVRFIYYSSFVESIRTSRGMQVFQLGSSALIWMVLMDSGRLDACLRALFA
jgi:hypothetical protein